MDLLPSVAMASLNLSSMSWYASSQLISLNEPEPFSPSRRSGMVRRSGSFTICERAMPRAQTAQSFSSDDSTFTSLPSTT